MTRKTSRTAGKLNRRLVLKGIAAGGAVVATEAIGGFPTVWAQTAKDVPAALARWRGAVDEIVLRAITAKDTVEENVALLQAARPA